jgi:hypothetical protein
VAAWAGCCESPPPAAARPSAGLRAASPSVFHLLPRPPPLFWSLRGLPSATGAALGMNRNPSAGDYAPAQPLAGVRHPARGVCSGSRVCVGLFGWGPRCRALSSSWVFVFPLFRAFYLFGGFLTPALRAAATGALVGAGPVARPLRSARGAPTPRGSPRLPTVAGERSQPCGLLCFSATRGARSWRSVRRCSLRRWRLLGCRAYYWAVA